MPGSGLSGLAQLEGRWTIRREITEAQGPGGSFGGDAEFVPDGEGLRYTERGRLYVPGRATLRAERSYLFRADGDAIAVLFADGRPFHRIALGRARCKAAHWCDPDQYDVSYDFSDWPDWSTRWQVRGPRKDYVMRTGYTLSSS